MSTVPSFLSTISRSKPRESNCLLCVGDGGGSVSEDDAMYPFGVRVIVILRALFQKLLHRHSSKSCTAFETLLLCIGENGTPTSHAYLRKLHGAALLPALGFFLVVFAVFLLVFLVFLLRILAFLFLLVFLVFFSFYVGARVT